MARRFPTFVVLLPVLAACSTTGTVDVTSDPASGKPVYFDGVTTRFAVCAEELPEDRKPDYKSLRNAVIAGDASLTAAASLFYSDGMYTLDLVLCNHGDGPVVLDRSNIKLYDASGIPLEIVPEWADGAGYGLRAEQTTVTAYEMLGRDTGTQLAPVSTPSGKGQVESAPMDLGSGTPGFDREIRVVERDFDLPKSIRVTPKHHVPYWAYWRARDEKGPMRVTLRVGDRRMVMEFEEPRDQWAR